MGLWDGRAFDCHVCGAPATLACGGCEALFYCSDAHCALHWRDGGHLGGECQRMRADVAEGAALRAALPFPWAAQATEALEQQRSSACAFLEACGLHRVGLWRRECACGAAGPFGACPVLSDKRSTALRSRPPPRRHAAAA